MPSYGAHIPVRHPNGIEMTIVAEDDDPIVGLDAIDLMLTKLAERGYTLGAEEADLEEGEKIETATSYVVGKTKAGKRAIWFYHFPRTMPTGKLYDEMIDNLWPYPTIDMRNPWPVATAPDYTEALAAGAIHELPEQFKFVRTPTGEMTKDDPPKPVTKITRIVSPVRLGNHPPQAGPLDKSPAPANSAPPHPTAGQPPPAERHVNGHPAMPPPPAATTVPPVPAESAQPWPPSEPPPPLQQQDPELRARFEEATAKMFNLPPQSEAVEHARTWFCQKYTYQKAGNDLSKSHGDINLLTDDDLKAMLETARQHARAISEAYGRYKQKLEAAR